MVRYRAPMIQFPLMGSIGGEMIMRSGELGPIGNLVRFARTDWWPTLKYFVLMLWGGLVAVGYGAYHWPLGFILTFTSLMPVFFLVGLLTRYAAFLLFLKSHRNFEDAYAEFARRKKAADS